MDEQVARTSYGPFGNLTTGVVKGEYVEVPLISHIEGNLYMGGCAAGVQLPEAIENVVSLYPWEQWARGDHVCYFETRLYDKTDGFTGEMQQRALHASHQAGIYVDDGPTLIHCQAGLNRSGLVAALVLAQDGRAMADAIELLREKRHRMVLCNETFEQWLLSRS